MRGGQPKTPAGVSSALFWVKRPVSPRLHGPPTFSFASDQRDWLFSFLYMFKCPLRLRSIHGPSRGLASSFLLCFTESYVCFACLPFPLYSFFYFPFPPPISPVPPLASLSHDLTLAPWLRSPVSYLARCVFCYFGFWELALVPRGSLERHRFVLFSPHSFAGL